MFDSFRQWFWNEPFWLGGNRTWAQYENAGYRRQNDIYYGVYTALVWLAISFVLKRYAFVALARWFGIVDKSIPKPQSNSILEKSFQKFGRKISAKEITGLAKQVDLTEREVERWLRLRRKQDCPSIVSKFADSAYKLTVYTFLFGYGMTAMWDKPCLWDSKHCFAGYPEHYVTSEIWWLYNLEFGVYVSFLVTQFFDIKRKDFWTMFIHHIVTLELLIQSWICNFTLIGSFTIVIHDVVDVVLEFSKCLAYLNKNRYTTISFSVFAVVWVITRLVIFPIRVAYYTLFAALPLVPDMPAYALQWIFISTLQSLHLIWSYFIIRIAILKWTNGTLKDSRSDDEDE